MPFGYSFGYGFGFTSGVSLAAFIALNGDRTRVNGVAYLVNSKGDDVLSTTGQMLDFNGTSDYLFSSLVPIAYQQQTIRISVDSLLDISGVLFGAGYSLSNQRNSLAFVRLTDNRIRVQINHPTAGGYTLEDDTIDFNSAKTLHATCNADIGEMALYVDGIEHKREIIPGLADQPLEVSLPEDYRYAIGCAGTSVTQRDYSKSNINDVYKWGGILSDSQILADFNNPENKYFEISSSIYEKEVNIPTYDSGDSSHVIVTTSNYTTIFDDITKQHFFIDAGAYTTKVTVTESGSESVRKTLSLNRPSDGLHPSKLNDNEQADIKITFDGASYWTLDRISSLTDNVIDEGVYQFKNGSTNNILNRMNMKEYMHGVIIYPFCHYNTIQNSSVRDMSIAGISSDNTGIAIVTDGQHNVVTRGTIICNNDIINNNDGVQLVQSSGVTTGSYPDTIIDSNNIGNDRFTDGDFGTSGLFNPDGQYHLGENAVDLKIGSSEVSEPVVFTNNTIFGYRRVDESLTGSSTGGKGTAFVGHYDVQNLICEDNIFKDCQIVFGVADKGTAEYSARNWSVRRNILYDIGVINPLDEEIYKNIFYNCKDIEFEDNILINMPLNTLSEGFLFMYNDTLGGCSFKNNVCIDAHGTSQWYNHDDPLLNDGVSIVDIDNNYYYESTIAWTKGTNDSTYTTKEEALMVASNFDVSKYPYATSCSLVTGKTSTLSPHFASLGQLEDREIYSHVFSCKLLEGTGTPIASTYLGDETLTNNGFTAIETSWGVTRDSSNGLQKIYFNADMTKANTMGTDANQAPQIITEVPSGDFEIKAIGSDDKTYSVTNPSLIGNITMSDLVTIFGATEYKSIEVLI